MKIIFDVMSGDHAPLETLKGARLAKDELDIDLVLVGREDVIQSTAKQNNISLDGLEIVHAADQMTMEDDPGEILKSKQQSSMGIGLSMLAQKQGDAFVSAGNTGALVMGATFIVKRIKGVKRPALAPILPSKNGIYMLIDVGANVECRPEMLDQFGLMGSIYMEKIMNTAKPRVGLVNIGTEAHKGTELQKQAYALMQNGNYHFIGNAEARDIPLGCCDVAVCDGWTGNIILKTTEGLAKSLMGGLKGIFQKNVATKLAAAMVLSPMKDFKKQMDYTEHGGAPLMGIKSPVIKAHGSSNAKAFKNAIRQAKLYVKQDVTGAIELSLQETSSLKER